jgi:hypothetical protein
MDLILLVAAIALFAWKWIGDELRLKRQIEQLEREISESRAVQAVIEEMQ